VEIRITKESFSYSLEQKITTEVVVYCICIRLMPRLTYPIAALKRNRYELLA